MVHTLKRGLIEFKDIVRLSGLSDLELSRTSDDNYKQILDLRIKSLADYDGLTKEEIGDIRKFRSNSKNTKRFSNIGDLIADLND